MDVSGWFVAFTLASGLLFPRCNPWHDLLARSFVSARHPAEWFAPVGNGVVSPSGCSVALA